MKGRSNFYVLDGTFVCSFGGSRSTRDVGRVHTKGTKFQVRRNPGGHSSGSSSTGANDTEVTCQGRYCLGRF